ncbi:MAG: energy-coupling factor ABC transporter substrate-binding protein [Chloroflexi bacterium]|nr:energy-coupling factor ABC transporter substrate-binding protein [Chloroflexota bacterium]
MRTKTFGLITTISLIVIVVVLAVIPLIMVRDSEFGGADGQAEGEIAMLAPNYEPWFSPLIELPGGETESLLFALQAAIGAGVIGYFLGFKRGTKHASTVSNTNELGVGFESN